MVMVWRMMCMDGLSHREIWSPAPVRGEGCILSNVQLYVNVISNNLDWNWNDSFHPLWVGVVFFVCMYVCRYKACPFIFNMGYVDIYIFVSFDDFVQFLTRLARARFILAFTAAVSTVLSFCVHLGDRHAGNVMIRVNGAYFHIDYGYVLGKQPLHQCPWNRNMWIWFGTFDYVCIFCAWLVFCLICFYCFTLYLFVSYLLSWNTVDITPKTCPGVGGAPSCRVDYAQIFKAAQQKMMEEVFLKVLKDLDFF